MFSNYIPGYIETCSNESLLDKRDISEIALFSFWMYSLLSIWHMTNFWVKSWSAFFMRPQKFQDSTIITNYWRKIINNNWHKNTKTSHQFHSINFLLDQFSFCIVNIRLIFSSTLEPGCNKPGVLICSSLRIDNSTQVIFCCVEIADWWLNNQCFPRQQS